MALKTFIFFLIFRIVSYMDTSQNKIKPDLFEYSNYRKYLRDLYSYYKSETNYFSYRYFSSRAGFKSPNFLKLVIDGRRNLTEKSIPKVSKALRMSKAEEEFFTPLVFFNQSSSMKEKSRFAQLLARTRISNKTYSLSQLQLKYYSNWYYVPIREMLSNPSFNQELTSIQEQFQGEVSVKQIQQAIDDLISLNLIQKYENGRYGSNHEHVATPDELISSVVLNYHFEMIDRAAESIVEYAPEKREVSTTCISCSEETVVKIKERIKEFRRDILALSEQDVKSDKIYQFNVQFFPVAGVKKRTNK